MANTESDLFFSSADNHYYLLISGRWFKTRDLSAGPWIFCTDKLPGDFKQIPEDDTTGRVLASVPGTEQAKEAVLNAHVPRTAEIKRSEASVDVSYEGPPEWTPVEGTSIEYAVNTTFDVFRVKDAYYCCYDGVWFVAQDPNGPWVAATEVPPEIYEIPPENPDYPVTYVYVYNSTPDHVYVGYLPGYWGVYYCGGVVCWGTGYHYWRPRSYWRHWYRHYWRHRPRPTPYGAGWRYHHRRAHSPTYGHGRYYDHLSGRYRRSARARRHQGNSNTAAAYKRWGKTARRPHAVAPRTGGASTYKGRAKNTRSDVYAGRDGSVYRKNGNTWERYRNGNWSKANLKQQPRTTPRTTPKRTTRPTYQPTYSRQRNLNSSARARSTYTTRRSTQYRSYRSSRGTRTTSYRRTSRGGSRGGGRRR